MSMLVETVDAVAEVPANMSVFVDVNPECALPPPTPTPRYLMQRHTVHAG